jgi:phage FluMu gp28-like protein
MCVASDDASAFIEWSLIDGCTYPAGENWEWPAPVKVVGADLYAGLDIGRHHDLTSMTIIEKVGGMAFTRKRIDLKGMKFSEQEAILYPWFEVCRRVCIDATGLGMQFAERSAERFGKYKCEGITFTGPMKEELAYPVRSAFEDRLIRIPFSDDKLKADIRAIRKETTAAGNVRFAADRGMNGHADRFWGLALALHAAKQPTREISCILC